MTNIYDFNPEARSTFEQAERQWKSSATGLFSAQVDKNPDNVAKAFDYSQITGAPAGVIHDNLDDFEQRYKAGLASQIIADSPVITNFINAHPLNAPLIGDDLGALDKFLQTTERIKSKDPIIEPFTKGFKEGFGQEGFGHWQDQNPQLKSLSERFPISSQLWTMLGVPFELGSRVFSGVVAGSKEALKSGAGLAGASEQGSEKFANDFAGMLEYYLMGGPGGEVPHITSENAARFGAFQNIRKLYEAQRGEPKVEVPKVPEGIDLGRREFLQGAAAAGAAAALPEVPGPVADLLKPLERLKDVIPPYWAPHMEGMEGASFAAQPGIEEALRREVQAISPYLQAGEVPPPGVSEVVDQVREVQAKSNIEALEDVLKDAEATQLKERSPEKWEEFLSHLPENSVRIDSEAIRKLYGDKAPEPGDNLFGWIPDLATKLQSGSVEISTKDFLTHMDGELLEQIRDDVALGDGQTVNEGKELRDSKASELPQKESGDPLLDSIRKGAGLQPPEIIIGTAKSLVEPGKSPVVDAEGKEIGSISLEDRTRQGKKAIQVRGVQIDAGQRGKGFGKAAYKRLVNQALAAGQEFWSDRSVEPEAKRIYESLKREGYKVEEQDPNAQPYDAQYKISGEPPGEPPREPPEGQPPSGAEPSKDTRLFTSAKAIGITEKEYSLYQKIITKRDEIDAAYRLRKAEEQARLENSSAWKEEEAKIRPEVASEVKSRPEVKAFELLQGKTKLSKDSLTETQINMLPKSMVGGKLHISDAANILGFDSTEGLVNSVYALYHETGFQERDLVRKMIDAEVNRRVQDKLGKTPEENLEEAKDHALSLTQMEMLHEQVVALGLTMGKELPLNKATMDWGAREQLQRQNFGGMSSKKLLFAAGKTSRRIQQALLKDDKLEAFKDVQQHYTQIAQAKEALAIEKETKRFEKRAKRYEERFTPQSKPPIPSEYVNWVQDILKRIGYSVLRSDEDLKEGIGREESQTLSDFVTRKALDGHDVWVPEFLKDPAFKGKLKDMNVKDARETMKAVTDLIKVGTQEKKVFVKGAKQDYNEFSAVIRHVIAESANHVMAKEPSNILWKGAEAFQAISLQVPTMLNRFDMGNAFGPMQDFVLRRAMGAQGVETKLSKEMGKAIEKIRYKGNLNEKISNTLFLNPREAFDPISGEYQWEKATPLPFVKSHLLAVMHNMGNVDNLERLATGFGVKPEEIVAWASTRATPEDWRYVTEFGKAIFETLRKPRNEMYQRAYNVTPHDIELRPVSTPIGEKDGWYHPIINDPRFYRTEKPPEDVLFPESYFFAGTPNGYTKSRTNYQGPLDLDLKAVTSRINQEIHDIAWREAVTDINKLLSDKTVLQTIDKHYGKAWADEIKEYPKRLANIQGFDDANTKLISEGLDFLRTNIVGSAIGLNPHTILKHGATAFVNSIFNSGVKPLVFAQAVRDLYVASEKEAERTRKFMYDSSDELPRRSQNWMEMAAGKYLSAVDVSLGGKYMRLRNTILRIGTSGVAMADLFSAEPLWLGAYRTARSELNKPHGDAVYFADRAVSRAHGSSAVTFRPGVMVGGQGKQWIASIYGFTNHIMNRQYELATQAGATLGMKRFNPSAAITPAAMAAGLFSYYIFPGLIDEYVTPSQGTFPGTEKDSWTDLAAKTIMNSSSMGYVGFRDLAHAVVNNGDPTIGLTNLPAKEAMDLWRDMEKKDLGMDKAHAAKTLKHFLTFAGAFSGLLPAQVAKAAQYGTNVELGRETPKDITDIYRGITKGEQRPLSGPDYLERLLIAAGFGHSAQRKR